MENQLAEITKCEQEPSSSSGIECGEAEKAKPDAPVQTTEGTDTELPMGNKADDSHCGDKKPKGEVQSGCTSNIKEETEKNDVLGVKEEKKDKTETLPKAIATMDENIMRENKKELSAEPESAVKSSDTCGQMNVMLTEEKESVESIQHDENEKRKEVIAAVDPVIKHEERKDDSCGLKDDQVNTSDIKAVESRNDEIHTNLPESPDVRDAAESQIPLDAGKKAEDDLKVEIVKCSFDFTEQKDYIGNQAQNVISAVEVSVTDINAQVEKATGLQDIEVNTIDVKDESKIEEACNDIQKCTDVENEAESQIAQEVEKNAKDDAQVEIEKCTFDFAEKKDGIDSQAKDDIKVEVVKCSFDFAEKKDDTRNQAQDAGAAIEEESTSVVKTQVSKLQTQTANDFSDLTINENEPDPEKQDSESNPTVEAPVEVASALSKQALVLPPEDASAKAKNSTEMTENDSLLNIPVEDVKIIPLQPSAPPAKEVEALSSPSYVVLESGPLEKVDPEAPKIGAAPGTAEEPPVYYIKWILWKGVKTPIVTQNVNGPCPLLAIVNVLLLKRQIVLPDQSDIVTSTRLLELIGDTILESVPKNIVEADKTNYEQNVNDALGILPKLQSGIDVNVKFTGISDFEYTLELALFDLVHIPLYHGWLVDREEQNEVQAVGSSGYNQLVERIITAKSQENQDLFLKAEIAEAFLERTASQLTYQGLVDLSTTLQDDELAVFFRNNHFSTLYKTQNQLFTLVTDQGFLQESKVVWETLEDINGSGQFVDANFMIDGKPLGGFTKDEQIGLDFQIAEKLQREADELRETSQLSKHTATPMSDEQLARQLQEEEERRARPASTGSPVGPGPSSGDGKRNSLPPQAPPKKEEKKSFLEPISAHIRKNAGRLEVQPGALFS